MSSDTMARIGLHSLLPRDLAAAHALSTCFGWPHRPEDWQFMLNLGEGVAATCDGELSGTALYWIYGEDAAAVGMLGVAPRLQGRGLGRRLLAGVLERLNGRSVVLHATSQGQRLYESFGFGAAGEIRQHQGTSFAATLPQLQIGERLRPTGRSDPAALTALDRDAHGMDRRHLIAALLDAGTGMVLDRQGTAAGFAVMRRFGIGQVIGPVVAPDVAAAQALTGHFLASTQGQFIRIDVPAASGLSPWLRERGLRDVGAVLRMLRGKRVGGERWCRSFALAGQGFG